MEINKTCGCGRTHDSASWSQLRFVGVQDPKEYPLELRDCPCGSTLGVELFSEVPERRAA